MGKTPFQRKLFEARRKTKTALLEVVTDVTAKTEIDTEAFATIIRLAIFSGLAPEDIARELSVSRNGVMRWADETMSPHELARGEFVVKIRTMLQGHQL